MWNVAQVNIGRMNAPSIDHPVMSEFVAQLETINKLAESSKGFVWRLKEEAGNATNIRFNALIQVMGSKLTGLRYVINDGRR